MNMKMQELEWERMHGLDAGTIWLLIPAQCLGKVYPAQHCSGLFSAHCLITEQQVDGGFRSMEEAKQWLLEEVQRWFGKNCAQAAETSQKAETLPDTETIRRQKAQTEIVRILSPQFWSYDWFRFFGIGRIDQHSVIYVYCSAMPEEKPITEINGHRLVYEVIDEPVPA